MRRLVLALVASFALSLVSIEGPAPLRTSSQAHAQGFGQQLDALPSEVRTAAAAYVDECEANEAGPSPTERFVTEVELNDDGAPDYIIDTGELNAPCFCGSGGCTIEAWVADGGGHVRAFESNVRGWQLSPKGTLPTVLVVDLHGTACGGVGADLCLKAMIYRDGKLIDTTAAP